MDEYGLMLTKVFVENISLPPEVEEHLISEPAGRLVEI